MIVLINGTPHHISRAFVAIHAIRAVKLSQRCDACFANSTLNIDILMVDL